MDPVVPLQRDAGANREPQWDLHAYRPRAVGAVECADDDLQPGAEFDYAKWFLLLHLHQRGVSEGFTRQNALERSATSDGGYYGPYFVANWITGTRGTLTTRASTTIYYTLDTFDPYGQLIMRSTILGPPLITKPTVPTCTGTACL